MTLADTPVPALPWQAEALAQRLAPLLPGLRVEAVASTGSTSTDLLERARLATAVPTLRVAEAQTAGRGRQGKTWHSRVGESLTFSLALPLAPRDWSGLSLAVGLALADALDPPDAGAPRLGLKWPNDLLLLEPGGPGRKLGGILIETVAGGAERWAVIGIGLNLARRPVATLDAAGWGYAGLHELDPEATAPAVLARLAAPLLRAVLAFERQGFAPLQPGFARRDALLGRPVTTTLAGWPEAFADGVAADGAIWLRQGERRERVASGELSLRPGSGTAAREAR